MSTPIAARAALAHAVAAAAVAVPGVARLSGGAGIEVATLYPGGKVTGVRVSEHGVSVHIVVDRLPLPPLIGKVRAATREALTSLGAEHPVDVVVERLNVEQLPLAAALAAGRSPAAAVAERRGR